MREFDLIERIQALLGAPSESVLIGPGDDAAVVRLEGRTAVSVDAAVEGVHFDLRFMTPWAVGRRAAAAALSDLAAMGATPRFALLDFGLRPGMEPAVIMKLVEGFVEECGRHGAEIVGGNITSCQAIFFSSTVIGAIEGDPLVRSGARPGDRILVSGELGGSSLAVEIMMREACLQSADTEEICKTYLIPNPRIGLGLALRGIASAAIDISDGLGQDLGHVAKASGVGALIHLSKVPRPAGFGRIAPVFGDPMHFMAAGGEDYELLVTVPPERLAEAFAAAEKVKVRLTEIGEIVDRDQGVTFFDLAGQAWKPDTLGWDHLR